MKYKRVTETAYYEYGRGKEFANRKSAMEEAEKVKKEMLEGISKWKIKDAKPEFKILENRNKNKIQLVCNVFIPLKEAN